MKRLLVATIAAAMLAGPLHAAPAGAGARYNAIYCVRPDTIFAAREQPDGKLLFGFMNWYRGFRFGLYGLAVPTGHHEWLYESGMNSPDPNERCQFKITVRWDGTPFVAADSTAFCQNDRGAENDVSWVGFSPDQYWGPVTHELDDIDGFFKGGGECETPRKPAPPQMPAPAMPGKQGSAS